MVGADELEFALPFASDAYALTGFGNLDSIRPGDTALSFLPIDPPDTRAGLVSVLNEVGFI